MASTDNFDLLIIGAGISGLAMARFYLEIHPTCRLTILERDACIGGSWSSDRLYDHFWTQLAHGYAEFSDLSMDKPPPEDMIDGFFKAQYTTKYLEQYADHHDFAGRSIRERIQFEFEVKDVQKTQGQWQIQAFDARNNRSVYLVASKIAIASGATSVPNMPVIAGSEAFDRPIVHTLNFGRSDVLSNPDCKHVTVIGAAKSAADMVYAAVRAGKQVSWVVRPDGVGPGFYAPTTGVGPYRGAFDIGSTRLAGHLSPSIMGPDNWLLRWLHGSKRGAGLIDSLWSAADNEMFRLADYKNRPCKGGFDKLTPHSGLFWQNSPGGLLNHTDFFDLVAQNVEIHSDHISHLENGKIYLQGGKVLETDALLTGTGWKHSFGYLSDQLCADLGLPHLSASKSSEKTTKWSQLESRADQEVASRFPLLADPPPHFHRRPTTEPYRLYNSIAPLNAENESPSAVVIGQVIVTNYFRVTECQAMWATAYLDGKLHLPSLEQREAEVARFVAYNRRRYLSNGEEGNFMTFETIAYTDRLLDDLGLRSHRSNFLRDLFYPCSGADMRRLKEEYVARFGEDDATSGHA